MDEAYEKVTKKRSKNVSIRVRIVEEAQITVCPYCNRDYINCRGDNVAGAQLDHFFSKSEYPIFAVCLYNLIPVCGNCNRIKSNKILEFVSPFDDTIDWENDIVFTYKPKGIKGCQVVINANGVLKNNVDEMKIRQAYEIHGREVEELLEKQIFYSDSQAEEFIKIFMGNERNGDKGENNFKITSNYIKKMVFGPEITQKDMKTKPLAKMLHDLHKELNIYPAKAK